METMQKNLLLATLFSCSLGVFSVVSRIEILALIACIVFLTLENLNEIGVKLKGTLKINMNEIFSFLSNHMWHGFEEVHDLIDFLEGDAYAGRNVVVDEEDVKDILAKEARNTSIITGQTFGNGKNGDERQCLLPMVLPKKTDTKKESVIVKKIEKPKGPKTQSTQIIVDQIDDETIEVIAIDKAHGVGGG